MTNRENVSSSTQSSDCNNSSKKVGSYILGETIGEGTFGKVKLAKHTLTGENVAIKILDKEKILDDTDILRVKKELSILQSLKHINVIQLYEIIHTPHNIYLVMEYADGGELFDYISSKKKLSELEACRFFQQMINSLEYLHKMRIVHRDLKPENLLLNNKKMIKVSDFGLSTRYSKKRKLKTACGTPSYAPPEMINGEEYEGLKSDIWSCGVILYAMIVGYLPFYESNEDIVCQKIVQAQYEFPHHISELAKDLIKRILVIDPEERLGLEEIKSHQFFNLITPIYRPGIVIGMNKIPVDEEILEKLRVYNLIPEIVRKDLEENELNQYTATYYLVMRKIINNGGYSISDLYSDAYLQYVNDKNNILCEDKNDFSEESEVKEESLRNQEEDKEKDNKRTIENSENQGNPEYINIISEEKCDFLSLVKDKYEETLYNSEKQKEKPKNVKKNVVKVIKIFNEKFKNKTEKISSADTSKLSDSKQQRINNLKMKIEKLKGNKTRNKENLSVSKNNTKCNNQTIEKDPKINKTTHHIKNYSVSPEKIYRALQNRDKIKSPLKIKVFEDISKILLVKKMGETSPNKDSLKLYETNSFKKEYKDLTINVIKEVDENNNIEENLKKNVEISTPKTKLIKPFLKKTVETSHDDSVKLNSSFMKKHDLTCDEKEEFKAGMPLPNPCKKKREIHNKLKRTNISETVVNLLRPEKYNTNKETKKNNITSKINKSEIVDNFINSKNTRNMQSVNQILLTNDISSNLLNFYSQNTKGNTNFATINVENKLLSLKNNYISDKRILIKDDEVKIYCGLIDVNCCFDIPAEPLLSKLTNALQKAKIAFIQPKRYKLRCSKTGLNFDIEICLLVEYNSRYLKAKKNRGETSNYLQLISFLLNEIHTKEA